MHVTPIILDLLLKTNQISCWKGKWYERRFDPDTVQNGHIYSSVKEEEARCNQQLKSFSRQGAKIWNSIPQELRKSPKCVFKKNIQNRLLQALMEEDDYVGTSFLIDKFQNKYSK